MQYEFSYRHRFFGIPLDRVFNPIKNGGVVGKALHLTEREKIQPVHLKTADGIVFLISGPGKSGYGSDGSNRSTAKEIDLEPGHSTVVFLNLGFTSTELIVKRIE